MVPSAGVFAADDAAVTELSAALVAAGYTVAVGKVLGSESDIAAQLETWIEEASLGVIIGTLTTSARDALTPLITKRLLGLSDLRDVDGGRCKTTLVVLVPPDGVAMTAAVAKVLPRLERELAVKSAPPVKVSIPERVGTASSTKHLPPVAARLPAAARENSVVAAIPTAPRKEVSGIAAIPPLHKKEVSVIAAIPRLEKKDASGIVAIPPLSPRDGSGRATPPPPPSGKGPRPPAPAPPAPSRSGRSPPPPPGKPAARAIATEEEAETIEPLQIEELMRPSAEIIDAPPTVDAETVDAGAIEPLHVEELVRPSAPIIDAPRTSSAPVDASHVDARRRHEDEEVNPALRRRDRAGIGATSISSVSSSDSASVSSSDILSESPSASASEILSVAATDIESETPVRAIPATPPPPPKPTSAAPPSKSTAAAPQKPAPLSNLFDAPPQPSTATESASVFDVTATATTTTKKRGIGLWIAIGGALVVAGGLAFVLLGSSSSSKPAQVATARPKATDTPQAPSTDQPTPPDPPPSDPTNATGSSAPPEIDMDVPDTTTGTTGKGRPTTGTTGTGRPTTGTTGTARPTTGTTGTTGTGTTKPVSTKPTSTVEAPVAADGCDKVSCVIDAYARPCCEQYRPKKPGDLPNELDRAMITTGMAKAKAAVIRCGELTPAAKGIVRLAMKVTPDGAVEEAGVSEAPDPALGECVSNAVRKVTFGKTELGGSFAYPFKF